MTISGGSMYAVSETLIERIRSQRESGNLDLSLCEITNIPLRAIKENYGAPNDLDLSYNLIGYIKPIFVLDMKNCTKLNLARNGIQKLPENFGEMDQLTYLDLHANQLTTLPVSMGRMHNLSYLNISENPFRAPLNKFLDKQKDDVFHTDIFPALLLEFLKGLASELPLDEYMEKLKMNRHRKSITFQDDHEKENDSSKPTKNLLIRKRKLNLQNVRRNLSINPKTKQFDFFQVLVKIVLPIVVILMIPLLLSVAIDTAFMDILTQDTLLPATIWKMYKPYHSCMQRFVNFCQPNRALIIRGPTTTLQEYGIFSAIRSYFMTMFTYVMNAFA